MSTIPNVIVSLWLLLLFLQLLLPLAMLCGWLLVKSPVYFSSLSPASSNAEEGKDLEKRAFRRIHANNLRIKVSDGKEFFNGVVCNISRLGICIMGLPDKIYQKEKHLSAVVDHDEGSYSLQIAPIWRVSKDSGIRIGASIIYAQEEWFDFVNRNGDLAFN